MTRNFTISSLPREESRPFARSDVRPEIFGDRVIYDLVPSFRRGGATLFPGTEAWMEPELGLVFLRANLEDIDRIERFFEELVKHEFTQARPMGVGTGALQAAPL